MNGLACQDWTTEQFDTAISNLKQVKKDAQSWSKARIEAIIVKAANKHGIEARTMAQLKDMYKKDSSPYFAAKLWAACYDSFDEQDRWEFLLESEYMHENQMMYCEWEEGNREYTKKGCFARLFCE